MASPLQGLIVDTSVLVTSERQGLTVGQILLQLRATVGDVEIGLSVITIVELAHGISRAKQEPQRRRRQAFVDDLVAALIVYPVTTDIAHLAGTIAGQKADVGITIPFEDLLIGSTALHLSFGVVTENVRHFENILGLTVRHTRPVS